LSEQLVTLLDRARPLIEPKAAYTQTRVVGFGDGLVRFENGHSLRGTILEDRLERGQEIIPYVMTIGPKLESEIEHEKNGLKAYMMDTIGTYAVRKAGLYVRSRMAETLGSERGMVSEFGPGTGTGELFDIRQQTPLFRMLESGPATIGVHLTSGLMMIPQKSKSGVYALTPEEYNACEYCPRPNCQGRRRPFLGAYQRIKST